jgi:hypothetical protein
LEFSVGFPLEFSREFSRGFSKEFSRGFSRGFSKEFSREFSRGFSKEFSRGFSKEFSRGFSRGFLCFLEHSFKEWMSEDVLPAISPPLLVREAAEYELLRELTHLA